MVLFISSSAGRGIGPKVFFIQSPTPHSKLLILIFTEIFKTLSWKSAPGIFSVQ